MMSEVTTPVLIPMIPEEFWEKIRLIVQQEINKAENNKANNNMYNINGLTYKPLYKISEVCKILQITRPTVYDWIKHEKLKPYKIQSRVYFLWDDIHKLFSNQ